jgi:aminoglycoside 6'-N-acetyltransferase
LAATTFQSSAGRFARIDTFIGEPSTIGQGHGSAFLRLLAERLRAEGAPVVAVDPDAGNLRARRACEKAGFCGQDLAETRAEPVVLMIFGGGVCAIPLA